MDFDDVSDEEEKPASPKKMQYAAELMHHLILSSYPSKSSTKQPASIFVPGSHNQQCLTSSTYMFVLSPFCRSSFSLDGDQIYDSGCDNLAETLKSSSHILSSLQFAVCSTFYLSSTA